MEPPAEEPERAGSPVGTNVLRLRGLPFNATADDIIEFFHGYTCLEVHICKRHGRANGTAYVVLSSRAEAKAAFPTLHKHTMGSRYIEIFNATEKDVEAVKALAEESKRQGYVVRLRGLPFSVTAAEVLTWLEPVALPRGTEAVHLTVNTVGRPTGEAYVELPDEEALQAVMRKHKEMIGPRYVEVFSSTRAEMAQALQQSTLNRNQASWSAKWMAAGSAGALQQFHPGQQLPAGAAGAAEYAATAASGNVAELTDAFRGFYLGQGVQGVQGGQRPDAGLLPGRLVAYPQPGGGAGGVLPGMQAPSVGAVPQMSAALLRSPMPAGMQLGLLAPQAAGGGAGGAGSGLAPQMMMHGGYMTPMQPAGMWPGGVPPMQGGLPLHVQAQQPGLQHWHHAGMQLPGAYMQAGAPYGVAQGMVTLAAPVPGAEAGLQGADLQPNPM